MRRAANQFPGPLLTWCAGKTPLQFQCSQVFDQAPCRRETHSFADLPHRRRKTFAGLKVFYEPENFFLSSGDSHTHNIGNICSLCKKKDTAPAIFRLRITKREGSFKRDSSAGILPVHDEDPAGRGSFAQRGFPANTFHPQNLFPVGLSKKNDTYFK